MGFRRNANSFRKGKTMRIVWLTIMLYGAVLMNGCEDSTPSPPHRMSSKLTMKGLGTYRPDGLMSFGYCVFLDGHDGYGVGGQRLSVGSWSRGYWTDGGWWISISPGSETDPFTIPTLCTTDRNGRAAFSVACDVSNHLVGLFVHGGCGVTFRVSDGHLVSGTGATIFRSMYGPNGLIDHMAYNVNGAYGAYWISQQGAYDGFEGVDGMSASPPVAAMSFWDEPNSPNQIMPTQEEDEFLLSEWNWNDFGYYVWRKQWVVKKDFFSTEAKSLYPLNHCDANTIEQFGQPYYLSYMIVLAEPIELEGKFIKAKIVCNAWPDGMEINIRPTFVSSDGLRVCAHTDFMIPVDSSAYNPQEGVQYEVFGHPVILVPVDGYETFNIVVSDYTWTVISMSDEWLTDNRTADITADGIVNFEDFSYLQAGYGY